MRVFLVFMFCILSASCSSTERAYIGTSGNDGIFLIEFDDENGSLKKIYQSKRFNKSGFITYSQDKKFLYTTAGGNKIKAFKIESDGQLTFLNEKMSTGINPCHIEISKSGKAVIVANYSGGGTTAISIATDGSFSGLARAHSHDKFYKEQGKFRQQNQPRAHNVCMSPDGRYVFISDLGLDKIIVYKFDDKFEKLSTNKPAYIKTTFGAGPRHFTFHPNGKFAYGINELNSSISFYLYEGQGKLNLKQDISTKPKNWTEANNCADIHVHPNGKFLYGSNRGNNSIAIFSINQQDGTLKLIGHESTRGNWPRNFAISPSGNHLLVANKKSHDIFTFKIDNKTGTLTYTGNKLELLHPICIKFINK